MVTSTEAIVVVCGLVAGFIFVSVFLEKNVSESSGKQRDDNESDSNSKSERQRNEQESKKDNASNQVRIFLCPTCSQKIKVSLPLRAEIGKCSNCSKRFCVKTDEYMNLYVTKYFESAEQKTQEPPLKTAEDCFLVLGLMVGSSSADIKLAYRTKMKGYHPDKVAHLGDKLKNVAELEAKRLNEAYALLKSLEYL